MKLKHLVKWNLFLLFFFLISCEGTEVAFDGFTEGQIENLLVEDTLKVWQRERLIINNQEVELSGCETAVQLSIGYESSNKQNKTLIYLHPFSESCPEVDTLFQGSWEVKTGFSNDSLFWISDSEERLYFIEEITSRFLTISRQDVADNVKESFQVKSKDQK